MFIKFDWIVCIGLRKGEYINLLLYLIEGNGGGGILRKNYGIGMG